MNKKSILHILLMSVFALFSFNAFAQEDTPLYKYEELDLTDDQSITNLNKDIPNIIEFFSYDCLKCYEMSESIDNLVKQYSNKITFERYPLFQEEKESYSKSYFTFHVWPKAFEIYNEKIHHKLYEEILFKNNTNLFDKNPKFSFYHDIDVKYYISPILKEGNIDIDTYDRIIEGEYIKTKINQAKIMKENYKVNESNIPLYVVDNKYVFSPEINGSYENTIKALTDYLEKNTKEINKKEEKILNPIISSEVKKYFENN